MGSAASRPGTASGDRSAGFNELAVVTDLSARIAAAEATKSPGQQASGTLPDGMDPGVVTKARDLVYRRLAVAPRPRAALEKALRAKEFPDDVIALVLDRFERAGLINDREYAELFVTAKHRERGLGGRALRAELRRHGVAEDDLADAVAQVDPDAERAMAERLVAKKLSSALLAGPDAARRRLLGQLDRRGYPADLATSVVDAALASESGQRSISTVSEQLR